MRDFMGIFEQFKEHLVATLASAWVELTERQQPQSLATLATKNAFAVFAYLNP